MPEQRGEREPPGQMTLLLCKTREQARIEGLDPRRWSEDDYAVVDCETRVGRIYKEATHGRPKWRWFLQAERGATTQPGNGRDAGRSRGGVQKALPGGQGQDVTGPAPEMGTH